jgi:lipopolysaccharide transport system permease protein
MVPSAARPDRLRRLVYLRDLLRELVVRDLTIRYKRSLLGVGWSLLVPLANLMILNFIFQVVLPLNVPHYTTFLYTGLLPWTWFHTSLMAATTSVADNRELVRQVGFPVWLLPIITVTSQFIHFLLALPFLFVFLWIDDLPITAAVAALPLVMALQALLILGLAYFLSTFQVFFHDTQHLLGIALTLLFYMTPVFYDLAAVPAQYAVLFAINPLVHILGAYRRILIDGELPPLVVLVQVTTIAGILLVFGHRLYMRLRHRFVQEL